jgi:two-component system, chemotaxis family, chemotaxis protein CheY
MRRVIQKALYDHGYRDVVLCESGEKALALLQTQSVDLIFLDWHMGQLSGLETLKLIRGAEKTRSIPVFMLTVEQHQKSVAEALKTGANDYIIKPVDSALLLKKILVVEQKLKKIQK